MRWALHHSKKTYRQRGAILVLSALSMTFLLSIIAISVDVGHLYLVRTELKNASDAASLAGANYLYPTTSEGKPNWSLAEEKALEAIPWNSADGSVLDSAIIETGYWDLTGEEPGIRAPSAVPDPGADDIAAVRVVMSKVSGQNGGPVSLYFGSFVGLSSKDVSADSVAGAGSPRAVEEKTLFPTVLPLSMYDAFWDYSSQKPKIDPSTGQPHVFDIGEDGANGSWTSFDIDNNDVTYMRDLIENGNPTQLAIGDEVYVVPGVKTTLYNSIPTDIDVTVTILDDTQVEGKKKVVGFGTMHIHVATGGNTKTITVNLIENHKTDGGEPGGYYYGTYAPAKLVY